MADHSSRDRAQGLLGEIRKAGPGAMVDPEWAFIVWGYLYTDVAMGKEAACRKDLEFLEEQRCVCREGTGWMLVEAEHV